MSTISDANWRFWPDDLGRSVSLFITWWRWNHNVSPVFVFYWAESYDNSSWLSRLYLQSQTGTGDPRGPTITCKSLVWFLHTSVGRRWGSSVMNSNNVVTNILCLVHFCLRLRYCDICSIDQDQQSMIGIEVARSLKLVRPRHHLPFFPLHADVVPWFTCYSITRRNASSQTFIRCWQWMLLE